MPTNASERPAPKGPHSDEKPPLVSDQHRKQSCTDGMDPIKIPHVDRRGKTREETGCPFEGCSCSKTLPIF